MKSPLPLPSLFAFGLALSLSGPSPLLAAASAAPSRPGCLACHEGIEPIRQESSGMMRAIVERGRQRGDPAGCVVCHGGDPAAREKEAAHGGEFFADPGSPWINEKTCGQCHPDHVRVQWSSLMMTEAGKIQGVTWTFGGLSGYEHRWGNYDFENPRDPAARLGSPLYRRTMEELRRLEPQVFVDRHEALPPAPTDPARVAERPELAAFTYLRNQCLRCHHAVKGRQVRGDYRGMGCSSCHIPYGNEGRYEGGDPTISREEPGHALVHSIQATREAKVEVHGKRYSGIPVETCTTCHDRGKRIGVSFQGLMEIPYESPFAADGGPQPGLHTKHYLAMQQDIHSTKGMLCQDCHTSIDVHGDGFLAAANLAAVEIECSDCHGTPDRFPWELPLGFGDEFGDEPARGPARGTSAKLEPHVLKGTVYPPRDGYLLTARGNAFTNVVRDGERVIVHTAAGKDIDLRPLKLIRAEGDLSPRGLTAMATVDAHLERMECYTCHAAWAPQCYGCHVKIDYSQGKASFDWLAGGHRHRSAEHAADRGEGGYDTRIPGQVEEQRSFTRWEDPMLGVNGEGRVTPIAPGCQPSITVIGADGKPILLNHIFRTPAGTEGGGERGQLAIDMSPTQPHTTTDHPRSCESCHASEKALGYGIGGGRLTRRPDQRLDVDLETADGGILPERTRPQREPIEGLVADWSRVVTEQGRQLQTVGHHFKRSRPLDDAERARVSREGVCRSCHQEIPDRSLAASLLHHVAKAAGLLPHSSSDHDALLHKLLLVAAWVQAGSLAGAPALLVGWLWWRRRRRRRRRGRRRAAPRGGGLGGRRRRRRRRRDRSGDGPA